MYFVDRAFSLHLCCRARWQLYGKRLPYQGKDGSCVEKLFLVRGRAKVRVLTEKSLFFLSQINTFNATSSLNKKCNKFMYWIHGQIISCIIIWEPIAEISFHMKSFLSYFFDLCNTYSGVINEWKQKSESELYQKERVQFKDQDFLERFSCIIEITSCEKLHRKKSFLILYETAGSNRVS